MAPDPDLHLRVSPSAHWRLVRGLGCSSGCSNCLPRSDEPAFSLLRTGGRRGSRTPDLMRVMHAL